MTALHIPGNRSRMSTLARLPWTLVIIIYMVVVHFTALFSPFNAFRTALRNLGLGVST